MKTLFRNNFPWFFYIIVILAIRLVFFGISWYSYLAVILSIYQFILLFDSIGKIIPVRDLLGSFMCIQFFIGPVFAYNGLDNYQYFMYVMKVSEAAYFSYSIPAVILFILGVNTSAGNFKGEVVNERKIAVFVNSHPFFPYIFIIGGFLASVVSGFFGAELAFVFYLLGSLKFIGLFFLILGDRKIKPIVIAIVIGSIVSSSLVSGMFHDLLTWLIFSASVFGIRYKFSTVMKLTGLATFIILVVVIQQLKSSYRSAITHQAGDISTFAKIASQTNEQRGFFSFESLAESNVRINQGFIITNIMITVPDIVPYENGAEMLKLLEAGIMPRILAPNKLKAGDRALFTKYSGIPLTVGTSMGLSSLGDAYINFGTFGGCIFMYFLGLLYSLILLAFHYYGKYYPALLLFTALVFYYPIRPDCELQTIFGHVFKSSFVVLAIMYFGQNIFRIKTYTIINRVVSS